MRGNRPLRAGALIVVVASCCGLAALSGSLGVARAPELLQLAVRGQPVAVEALALPSMEVPSAERRRQDLPLPYEPEPEDPASVSDALEIAQRRIEEAYAEVTVAPTTTSSVRSFISAV